MEQAVRSGACSVVLGWTDCREFAVLRRLQPAAFVMENVKGILSSSVEGQLVFEGSETELDASADPYISKFSMHPARKVS
jgi:hypothetical protein